MNNTRLLSIKTAWVVSMLGVLLSLLPLNTRAATFSLVPDTQVFGTGSMFTIDVKVDTEGVGVNAAQGTISFSPAVLEVTKIERTTSVFNFWLEEPTFSNTAGTVTFLGGSTNGFTGSSLSVFRIQFKVKGIGTSAISFTDGAISASDGSGTNVMKATKGIEITSVASADIIKIAPPQITRTPTTAKKVPALPTSSITLYPNEKRWYNASTPFTVSWTLPSDISAVASLISKDPRATPTQSEGLFDNKQFNALTDGTWYLHLRFKNNVGWGETLHRQLNIDSIPPLPFEVRIDSGTISDNPSPLISYKSADQLSGIKNYHLSVDSGEILVTTSTSVAIPPQAPGKHKLKVRAEDNAGNSTESIADFTITPIESPIINLSNTNTYANEGGLNVHGTTLPNASVKLILRDIVGGLVLETSSQGDVSGNWNALFDQPLKIGTYTVHAIAIDTRGAQSLPTISSLIEIRERPILTLGGVTITKSGIIWILITLLGGGIGAGIVIGRRSRSKQQRHILIAERDVTNAFHVIKKDLEEVLDAFSDHTITTEEQTKIEAILKRAHEHTEKTERYIVENINEISG